jgi:very-short-patch-repair endonuclease
MSQRARQLRQDSTDAERALWKVLRSRLLSGYKFRRQHPIGRYIADFACIELKLIVEADGGQHNDSPADEKRTLWLKNEGWKVLRFWNNGILSNTDGGLPAILDSLREH